MRLRPWPAGICIVVAGSLLSVAADTSRGQSQTRPAAPPRALLVAEDGRASTRDEAAGILRAMDDPSPAIVRRAVLALGRLELPLFLPDITRVLSHADAGVRAEAVHALAHAAGGDPSRLVSVLRDRLLQERAPEVRGVILETLGRLSYKAPGDRASVEPLLAQPLGVEATPLAERLGAAEGLDSLIRGARGTAFMPSADTLRALRQTVFPSGQPADNEENDRLRRLALSALNGANAVDAVHAQTILDRDEQVRRLAVAGVGRDTVEAELRRSVVTRGLADSSAMVRYEALRVHGRLLASDDCSAELTALTDPHPHVALLAIDLLGTACRTSAEATRALAAFVTGSGTRDPGSGKRSEPPTPAKTSPSVSSVGSRGSEAERVSEARFAQKPSPSGSSTGSRIPDPGSRLLFASRALVSLARRDPQAARTHLGAFAAHPTWLVRVAAARAAALLNDGTTLAALASDVHDNVREAAIEGLTAVKGHGADDLFIGAVAKPSYQVVMAAARALAGTPDKARAVPALLGALAALTAEKRDTSRDPRSAILTRLEELGGASHADALRHYLSDADPEIASRAARLLSAWTGTPHTAATSRVVPLPVPSQQDLDSLPQGMRIVMADGRSFDVTFDTWDATMTVWRVSRLAQQGYYSGLTFHRIVPNFVIQGGSPGANEFVGDGPFMRDECGPRSNLRYSIGISTRGRDTGDAQLYVNLVDNERLDHHYPVFGEVVQGTAVIDAIIDGDVIARVDLLRGGRK